MRDTMPEPVEAGAADQVAVLIYTSGTTGTPKGVMLSHENLLFSARTTADIRRMAAADKQYIVLPISHIVGISLLIMTLMSGATVKARRQIRSGGARARNRARRASPSSTACPATYQRLLEYKAVAGPGGAAAGLAAADRGGRRAAGPRPEIAGRAGIRPAAC